MVFNVDIPNGGYFRSVPDLLGMTKAVAERRFGTRAVNNIVVIIAEDVPPKDEYVLDALLLAANDLYFMHEQGCC